MPLATSLEERWMQWALKEGQAALEEGEWPVGAVVLHAETGLPLARAHHQTAALNDPTAHALMIALSQLAQPRSEPELNVETLEPAAIGAAARELVAVVSQEPCLMCAGAVLLHARIARLIYGARDPQAGACESKWRVFERPSAGRPLLVQGGILAPACDGLLRRWRSA